jgi:hypothetical protein
MFEFTKWHASFPDFFIHLRHYTGIGKQYCFQMTETGFAEQFLASHRMGACTDLFENLSVNSLQGECYHFQIASFLIGQ